MLNQTEAGLNDYEIPPIVSNQTYWVTRNNKEHSPGNYNRYSK